MWHTIDVYISYIVFKLEEAARVNFKSKQEIFNITKLNIITPQITQPTHRDRDRQTNKQDTDTLTHRHRQTEDRSMSGLARQAKF